MWFFWGTDPELVDFKVTAPTFYMKLKIKLLLSKPRGEKNKKAQKRESIWRQKQTAVKMRYD